MSLSERNAATGTLRTRVLSPARLAVWERAATHALCGLVPVGFTIYMIFYAVGQHAFAVDFHSAFWPAGSRVLHGLTPYAAPTSYPATHGFAFVYPAPGALVFAAFGWMPQTAADVVFTIICFGAAMGTLAVLRIRDWRLYGMTLLWPAVLSGWQTANLSLLLALGIAVAWRYRDRPAVAGIAIGVMVSLKLFLWPLLGWLALTRRWRALAWTAGSGLVINTVSWAVLGFNQIHAYLHLVNAVTNVEEATAYTPLALGLKLGLSHNAADLLAGLVFALVALVTVNCARRGRESGVLLGVITISLLATPIVWRHYFVLFLVPLAISRPRLSAAWTIPLLLFVCPVTSPVLWQLVLAMTAMGLLVFVLFRWPTPISLRRPQEVHHGATAGGLGQRASSPAHT
jgi:hypothetical protein